MRQLPQAWQQRSQTCLLRPIHCLDGPFHSTVQCRSFLYHNGWTAPTVPIRAVSTSNRVHIPNVEPRRWKRVEDNPNVTLARTSKSCRTYSAQAVLIAEESDATTPIETPVQEQNTGTPSDVPVSDRGSVQHEDDGGPEVATFATHRFSPVIDGRCFPFMIETLRKARLLGLPDVPPVSGPDPYVSEQLEIRPEQIKEYRKAWSKTLARKYASQRNGVLGERINERRKLPIMAGKAYNKIIEAIDSSDVTIIVGQTGSGKTTQLPQIILDFAIHAQKGAFCKVVCTQPRRISATSVARRVAFERNEALGESVGYAIRFSSKRPRKHGSIVYCTTGILLKELQLSTEATMTNTSHIILDEVHERSIGTDSLLTMVRDLIRQRREAKRPYPKVILMSATLDSEALQRYFEEPWKEQGGFRTTTLMIEGRSFPIKEYYLNELLQFFLHQHSDNKPIMTLLEDNLVRNYIEAEVQFAQGLNQDTRQSSNDADEDGEENDVVETSDSTAGNHAIMPAKLVVATIAHIAETTTQGDILVFLPGLGLIDDVAKLLLDPHISGLDFTSGDKFRIFRLHSTLAETNDEVFNEVPSGTRRIVLATNIAETSITLPDVEHVVDTGKQRLLNYRPETQMHSYGHEWISRSSSAQRKGRAGRVRAGNYYALFTTQRHNTFSNTTSSEIQRTDLTEAVLDLTAQESPPDVQEFFSRAPDPPKRTAVATALSTLKDLGALTADERITPLGRVLSRITIHPTQSKAILIGIIFRCLGPMLFNAAHGHEDPLVEHTAQRLPSELSRRAFAGKSESDQICLWKAFKEYDDALASGNKTHADHLTNQRYVSTTVYDEVLMEAKEAYIALADEGLLPPADEEPNVFRVIPPELNANADNEPLIKALMMLCSSSHLAVRKRTGKMDWTSKGEPTVLMFPRSVNSRHSTTKLNRAARLRTPEDICSYTIKRQNLSDKHPWIVHTTMVTPIIALLFSPNVHPGKHTSKLYIDEWLRAAPRIENNTVDLDPTKANILLFEMRKAIDRFILLGLSELDRVRATTDLALPPTQRELLRNTELRDTFINGLIKILNQDNEFLQERLARDREKAERFAAEEEEQKEKLKRAKELKPRVINIPLQ